VQKKNTITNHYVLDRIISWPFPDTPASYQAHLNLM